MNRTGRQTEMWNRAVKLLNDKGYTFINECEGPNKTSLTFASGPKGVVIVQEFTGSKSGIEFYLQTNGNSWESVENAL